MYAAIDSIEDGIVRIETCNGFLEKKLEEIPFEICEGDVLVMAEGKIIDKDDEEKKRRKERISSLLAKIRRG